MAAPELEPKQKLLKALQGGILDPRHHPRLQHDCVSLLLTITQNVLEHPAEEKYRRIKATSAAFKAKVSAVKGAEDFLWAAGWRREVVALEPFFVLPAVADEELLRAASGLLRDVQKTCAEKAERHEREQWQSRNEDRLRREQTLAAIADDRERKRDALTRSRDAAVAAAAAGQQQQPAGADAALALPATEGGGMADAGGDATGERGEQLLQGTDGSAAMTGTTQLP